MSIFDFLYDCFTGDNDIFEGSCNPEKEKSHKNIVKKIINICEKSPNAKITKECVPFISTSMRYEDEKIILRYEKSIDPMAIGNSIGYAVIVKLPIDRKEIVFDIKMHRPGFWEQYLDDLNQKITEKYVNSKPKKASLKEIDKVFK
jgi:hypothetical protein